ncbi:MAG: hypothetical protein AAFY71_05060 [Bacteroidota bacterium]
MKILERLNKAIPFWPLILLYVAAIAVLSKNTPQGDEIRYFNYAELLLKGTFVSDPADPSISNGPGLPLLCALFLVLRIPLYWSHFINAFFFWGTLVYLKKCMTMFTEEKKATRFAYFFGLYPLFFVKFVPDHKPEIICLLLLTGFFYYFMRIVHQADLKPKNFILGGLYFGFIILVKAQFAYLAIAGILFSLIYFAFTRQKKGIHTAILMASSFVITIPYLIYTFSLTGKSFYWVTNGGEQLYWMTTPYEGQWGNWISPYTILTDSAKYPPEQVEFFKEIRDSKRIRQQELYIEAAKENFNTHPESYIKNYIANWGRMTVNFPHTYTPQSLDTFVYIVSNVPYLILFLLSFIPLWTHWRRLPYYLVAMFLLSMMYLGGTSLLSAVNRYSVLALPFIIIWLAFIEENFVTLKIKSNVSKH